MLTISTHAFVAKVADHYGTQPNMGTPSQNVDGPAGSLFRKHPGEMTGMEFENLWKKKKSGKKKKKKGKPKSFSDTFV